MPEKKSVLDKNRELGNITVSKEVVATIAALETVKNKGVVGIVSGYKGKSANILPENEFNRGVEVWMNAGEATVTISIITDYEIGIYKVAREVQQKVKNILQSMTGLKVLKVDINVMGVKFKEEEKKQKTKKDKVEK
ncbi:MAG: Asp23/Gls24 family envelope stress response protein [Candidatus Caldatribacteriota bacterium]|nr:Asp23/Gls24 family envelope stress response protein [Candidatus Caldatribacteriota bacterium]